MSAPPDGAPRVKAGPAADGTALRDFSRSLPMALLRAREAVMDRFRPMLRDHGVTEQQWRVLRALATDRADISTLAARCCILAPSLTRILRNLEGRGLVSRRRGADGRVAVIAISASGRRLIDKVAPHSEALYADIAAAVGPDRIEALYALLEEVDARLR